jgi:hypothetical protein
MNINMNMNINNNDHMFFKNWLYVSKQITSLDINNECPISIEPIKINEWYCKCNQCNHNISFVSFYQMVSINKYTITCPICRCIWNNKIFYLNNNYDNNNRTFTFYKKILQYKLKIHRKKHKIINYFENKIDGISNYFAPPHIATNGYLQVRYDEFVMDNDDLYSLNLPNNLPNDIINKEEKKFWYCVFIFYIIIIFIMYLLI